jgi:hypothetical protein
LTLTADVGQNMRNTKPLLLGLLAGVILATLFFSVYPTKNYSISTSIDIPGTDVTIWMSRQEPITFFHDYDRMLEVMVNDETVFKLPLLAQRREDTTINLYVASSNTYVLRDRLHTYSVFVDGADVSCLVGEATHTNLGWEYCGTFTDGIDGWNFYSPQELPEPVLSPAKNKHTSSFINIELPEIQDREALINDSVRIIRDYTNASVPEEEWPASLLSLAPSFVGTYRDYLFITIYETNQLAKGYMISPINPGTSPLLDGVFILRLKDPIIMQFDKTR